MAKIHLPFKVKVGKTVKGLVCGLNGLATKSRASSMVTLLSDSITEIIRSSDDLSKTQTESQNSLNTHTKHKASRKAKNISTTSQKKPKPPKKSFFKKKAKYKVAKSTSDAKDAATERLTKSVDGGYSDMYQSDCSPVPGNSEHEHGSGANCEQDSLQVSGNNHHDDTKRTPKQCRECTVVHNTSASAFTQETAVLSTSGTEKHCSKRLYEITQTRVEITGSSQQQPLLQQSTKLQQRQQSQDLQLGDFSGTQELQIIKDRPKIWVNNEERKIFEEIFKDSNLPLNTTLTIYNSGNLTWYSSCGLVFADTTPPAINSTIFKDFSSNVAPATPKVFCPNDVPYSSANGSPHYTRETSRFTNNAPCTPEVKPSHPEVKPIPPEVKPISPEVIPSHPEVKPNLYEVIPSHPEVKPSPTEVTPIPTEVTARPTEATTGLIKAHARKDSDSISLSCAEDFPTFHGQNLGAAYSHSSFADNSSLMIQQPNDLCRQPPKFHTNISADSTKKLNHDEELDNSDMENAVGEDDIEGYKTKMLDENFEVKGHKEADLNDSTESAQQTTGHKVDEVLPNLQTNKSLNSSSKPPDYDELIKAIALIASHIGRSATYVPAVGNYYRILVRIGGSQLWRNQIKNLEKRYPGYTLIVRESEDSEWGDPPALHTKYLHKPPFYLMDEHHNAGATVGLFVKSSHPRYKNVAFAVTAAHAILTESEQKTMDKARDKKGIKETFKKAAGRICDEEYFTVSAHNQPRLNVRDTPLPFYSRHYVAEDEDNLMYYEMMAGDTAFLALDSEKLNLQDDEPCPPTDELQTHSEQASLTSMLSTPKCFFIDGYLNVSSQKDIDLLVDGEIAVFVLGTKGKVVMNPQSTEPPKEDTTFASKSTRVQPARNSVTWKLSTHITITTKEKLKRSDSGAPVLAFNTATKMMIVIGLLMGEYIGDEELNENISVYQVAPFSCALRQMEHNFPNHLRELRLIAGRIDIGLPVSQALPQLYRDDFSKEECGTFDVGYNTLSLGLERSKSGF